MDVGIGENFLSQLNKELITNFTPSKRTKIFTTMKKFNLLLILSTMLAITSCTATESSEVVDSPITRYNIVVVLDGTDRLQAENVVPMVGQDEALVMASQMLESGVGTMYFTYVDNNSDNNKSAILDFDDNEPKKPEPRPSYVPVSEYRAHTLEPFEKDSIRYENSKALHMHAFERDCALIVEQAYSDVVATNKRGSDVIGAINQAYRLLKPNMTEANRNIIILVSDGVDNVGKELQPKPKGVELYLVNGTVSKHSLGDMVDNEFVTINQIINHIFK